MTATATRTIDDARDLLEQGITAILDGDAYQAWLRMVSRMHRYSWANCLLIALQKPDASMIAGYRKWQELGRQVRKGEKSIRIFAPVTRRRDDDPDAERVVVNFKAAAVFDISQTDGDEIPQPPRPAMLEGDHPLIPELTSGLMQWCSERGITVERAEPRSPGALGDYDPKQRAIRVRPDLEPLATLKTLVHEVAHAAADHQLRDARCDVETVAESVAFVVLHHVGIDTSAYTFPYVAGWAQDTAILTANMSTIQKTARVLIDAIEQEGEGPKPSPRRMNGAAPMQALTDGEKGGPRGDRVGLIR